jgi:class 3 adenylate cyclase
MLSYQLGISIENVRLYENLSRVNKMYQKFVPLPFLHTLGHDSILNVRLGDQIQREMTILFTDIRSYTTISESLSPEENFRFINEYLSYTAPCIEQHEGFINSFTGDGIMALFADPEKALEASITLQREVRLFNAELEKANKEPIRIGVGLHTGRMMLGVIGDEDRHDTGVISNEVNTASRIEGLTKMFNASVLLSESTVSHISNMEEFDYRFLGIVQVKGRSGAIKVYECFSGDPENVIELKKKTLDDFNKGLASYFNKDFIIAAGHLKNVLNIDPGDVTADRYFRHAAELMVRGVDNAWTGVEIMTEK